MPRLIEFVAELTDDFVSFDMQMEYSNINKYCICQKQMHIASIKISDMYQI